MRINDLHLTAQEVMSRHGVTVHQLAARAGYADSTVYEYTGGGKDGKYLMWPILLSALYELTGDQDCLLVNNCNVVVARLDVRLKIDTQMIAENTRRFAALIEPLGRILEDGKIDERDIAAIDIFRKAAENYIQLLLNTISRLNEQVRVPVPAGNPVCL